MNEQLYCTCYVIRAVGLGWLVKNIRACKSRLGSHLDPSGSCSTTPEALIVQGAAHPSLQAGCSRRATGVGHNTQDARRKGSLPSCFAEAETILSPQQGTWVSTACLVLS